MKLLWFSISIFLFVGCGGSCFVGDCLVSVPEGQKKISSLRVNDEVLGYDLEKGKFCRTHVLKIHKAISWKFYRVESGSNVLRGVTGEHPIYARSQKRYSLVDKLRPDETIELQFGDSVISNKISTITKIFLGPRIVYNVTVSGKEGNF